MPDIQSEDVAVTGPVPEAGALTSVEREFTIQARTQREMVLRRFFRHRGAMGGLLVFVLVLLLAYSSIGVLGLPGWWHESYETAGTVENGGAMTLDVLPPFLDGDGLAIGNHPFGQDDVGRDYFALTMRGTQISVMICVSVGIISTLLGVLIGAFAGYYRGFLESVLMRFTDLVLTIPLLVLASVVAVTFANGGPLLLALALGLLLWPNLARLVRGEFLSLREKEFVEAARAMGAPNSRIIFRHILPNTLGTIIVNATLTISAAIILETALSFLGFGVQSPDTSLGKLISDYQAAFQTRPWLFWWPGMFIVAIALSVNFVGDGLRDAFDPKQTRVRA
jgi:ABC-type dipeptide/oligopeptide/nickel transport system permease subunit